MNPVGVDNVFAAPLVGGRRGKPPRKTVNRILHHLRQLRGFLGVGGGKDRVCARPENCPVPEHQRGFATHAELPGFAYLKLDGPVVQIVLADDVLKNSLGDAWRVANLNTLLVLDPREPSRVVQVIQPAKEPLVRDECDLGLVQRSRQLAAFRVAQRLEMAD